MRYSFELKGISSLLVHADNVVASDDLMAWRKDPSHKSVSVAGDDRSPPWSWMSYLYSDGESLCLLSDAIMVALRFAGAKMIMKKQESYKSATQSGILIADEFLPILVKGKPVRCADIARLKNLSFAEQLAGVEKLGFKLDVRRAVVGSKKHLRVRPRFDDWTLAGELDVDEPAITTSVLTSLLDIAGKRAGVGDWRPSARASGPHGRFTAVLTELD